ncbi:hypothetical protein [Micromonospora pisi]|uniref:hypothetical protein n=1 Tax=Micromonospora pisi TaxID=589240 RepID=UPI000EAD1461|nr:hypothetical protein [Micromonospora pisi]
MPNVFIEPRGLFLGAHDRLIQNLGQVRSITGVIVLSVIPLAYNPFFVNVHGEVETFGRVERYDRQPALVFIFTEIFAQAIIGTLVSLGIATLVGAALVAWARPGFRRRTLWQFRWPLVSILAFVVLLVVFVASLLYLGNLGNRLAVNQNDTVRLGIMLGLFGLGALPVMWMLNAFYLAFTGLFRAEDGHPLLGPLTIPLAAWGISVWSLTHQNASADELINIPPGVALWTAILGPTTLTLLSVATLWRLRGRHPDDFPFRNGPPGAL